MAYGLAFYKGIQTGFDEKIAQQNAANPGFEATNLAAQIADNTGISATRATVVEAFQASSITPLLPSNSEIRTWMISGLGNNNSTFNNYYSNLYYGDANHRAKVISDRQFETTIKAPLRPDNNTLFLLGIDNGYTAKDVSTNNATVIGGGILRDSNFYNTFPKSPYLGTVAYSQSNYSSILVTGVTTSIPKDTNWCAEAYIYPVDGSSSGGIIGTDVSTFMPDWWNLSVNNGQLVFLYQDYGSILGYSTTGSTRLNRYPVNAQQAGIVTGSTKLVYDGRWPQGTYFSNWVSGRGGAAYLMSQPALSNSGSWDANTTFYYYKSGAATLTSSSAYVNLNAWNHVAVSLSGTTLQLFLNGTRVAYTTITPRAFTVVNSYYIGRFDSNSFNGYIASPRMTVGSAVYTGNFTPSSAAPLASRASVMKSYAKNLVGPVQPDEMDIQKWMYDGFGPDTTLQFSTTDVTWNQVDNFYKSANTTISNTYPSCAGREMLVTQILVGTPDINKPYYSNTISTNSGNGSVYITGANVDTYIMVMMR